MRLDVVLYEDPDFDSYVKEGITKGLDLFFGEHRCNYRLRVSDSYKKIVKDDSGRLLVKETLGHLTDHKIDDMMTWEFVLTKAPLFHEERGSGFFAFFSDQCFEGCANNSLLDRIDLANCIISDDLIKTPDEELGEARGLIVSYHEAFSHSGKHNGHCSSPECISYEHMSLEDLDRLADYWIKYKRVPKCEMHT